MGSTKSQIRTLLRAADAGFTTTTKKQENTTAVLTELLMAATTIVRKEKKLNEQERNERLAEFLQFAKDYNHLYKDCGLYSICSYGYNAEKKKFCTSISMTLNALTSIFPEEALKESYDPDPSISFHYRVSAWVNDVEFVSIMSQDEWLEWKGITKRGEFTDADF